MATRVGLLAILGLVMVVGASYLFGRRAASGGGGASRETGAQKPCLSSVVQLSCVVNTASNIRNRQEPPHIRYE